DEQRRGLVAGGTLVDVGAGVEERAGRLDVALPRRQMQRREAAPEADELGVVVLARHARNLRPLRSAPPAARRTAAALLREELGQTLLLLLRERREVLHLRRRQYVGLVRREHANNIGAPERGGERERRLAFDVLAGVDVGPFLDQHLHGVGLA